MPDRATEVRSLQLADRHIADAIRLKSRVEVLIEAARLRGSDAGPACEALLAMEGVLQAFIVHRDMIRQTIADIDSGHL